MGRKFRMLFPKGFQRTKGQTTIFVLFRTPQDDWLVRIIRTVHIDIIIELLQLGIIDSLTQRSWLPHVQQQPMEFLLPHQQIIDKHMPITFRHIWPGTGMPAEVITYGASSIPRDAGSAVHKRIAVNLNIRAIERSYAVITIDKHIAGAKRAFRYFKEKAIIAGPGLLDGKLALIFAHAFDPIIQKTDIHIADIIPDAV